MVSIARQDFITAKAREVLSSFWRHSVGVASTALDIDGFFPLRVDLLARQVGLEIDEPDSIPSDKAGFEVAGMIDRPSRRITIAQKFPAEYRRFTTAHEIGHWFLHPSLTYHRDRPIQGGEHSNPRRETVEQEPDLFAAELLMPRKRLHDLFSKAFGSPISGRDREKLELLQMHKPQLNLARLESELRLRSLLIAEVCSLGPVIFRPLHRVFGVSVTAMAIQLEDLRLVT
jgi:hypothetical protein